MSKSEAKTMFEPEMPVVPADWEVLPFKNATKVVSDKGKRVKQRDYQESGKIPVIDQGQNFIGGYTDEEDMAFYEELPVILFGDHTRSIKYVDKPFAVGAEGVKILKPAKCYIPKFFYFLLRSLQIPSRGYSRHFQFLKKFYLPVAPETQQKRIVAEIEKQFSRLDEAVANLKRVKANLKRYKASVLKAAVEGKLTEEWRAKNEDVEPANKLLERILAERRKKWEEVELAKMKAKGKEPKDDKWKKKYQEPESLDASRYRELPAGWKWCRVEQLGGVIGGLTKNRKREHHPIKLPYLRVANVYANELRLDEVNEIGLLEGELDRSLLEKGDLLVVEGNGSPSQIGRLAIWDGSIDPCVHQNHLIKVRLVEPAMGQFILWWLLSVQGRSYVAEVASSTSGLYTLSISKVGDLPIPLPPIEEQRIIIEDVDRRVSVANAFEKEVDTNLKRAEHLRKSILKKAYSGELVPHELADINKNKLYGIVGGGI